MAYPTQFPQGFRDEEHGVFDPLNWSTNQFIGQSHDWFGKAAPAIDAASNYYLPILSGNRAAMAAALGPETDIIAKQYDAAASGIRRTAPRGGGRDFALAQAGFQQAGDVGRLFSGARPAAAKALTDIGFRSADVGTQAGQVGMQGSQAGLGFLGQRRGQDVTARGQDINAEIERQRSKSAIWSAIGAGVGSLAKAFLAKGGTVTKPTMAMVGEEGPEMAFLPPGSSVVPMRENYGVPRVSPEKRATEHGRRMAELLYRMHTAGARA